MNTESPESIWPVCRGYLSAHSPPDLPPVHPLWPASAPPRTEARQCCQLCKTAEILWSALGLFRREISKPDILITYLLAVPKLASWKLIPCLREQHRSRRKLWTSSLMTDIPACSESSSILKKKLNLDLQVEEHIWIRENVFQQPKENQLTLLSSVVASTIPFHLYRDAMLANTAGVKKRTFCVLLMPLFSTTCSQTNNNSYLIHSFIC